MALLFIKDNFCDCFAFKVDPISEGRQKSLTVASSESVSISLKTSQNRYTSLLYFHMICK